MCAVSFVSFWRNGCFFYYDSSLVKAENVQKVSVCCESQEAQGKSVICFWIIMNAVQREACMLFSYAL